MGTGAACTLDSDCEEGNHCNANVCTAHILKNQACTYATDICENGHICSDFASTGATTCREIFSVDDSVQVSHPAACKGGYMADYGGSNMCYTPTELVQ